MTRIELDLTAHTGIDSRMNTAVRDCVVTRTDCHEHGAMHTTWQCTIAAVMGVIFAGSGCIMAVGPHLLPSRTRVVHRDQAVQVTSEPSGAEVTRDGVVVGKTPTDVELQYDQTMRLRDCRFTVPLAILDFALAGVALWGGYSLYKSNRDAEAGTPQALYNTTGLLGMVLAVPYAIATLNALGSSKSKCREAPKVVGQTSRPYDLHVAVAGSEERLSIVAPTEKTKFNIVFRELEDKRWRTAIDSDDDRSYRRYLDDYPSGRWRGQAKERIEELTWRRASATGTASALWGYLREYPSGHRRAEAEHALKLAVEAAPGAVDKKTLRAMLLGDNGAAQALVAGALLRQGADADVKSILTDGSINKDKRLALVAGLGVAMQSREAAAARDILCGLAHSRDTLAATLRRCERIESPECDVFGGREKICRSDVEHRPGVTIRGQSCVFLPKPKDCGQQKRRQRCQEDAQQELELAEAAATVGQCQGK